MQGDDDKFTFSVYFSGGLFELDHLRLLIASMVEHSGFEPAKIDGGVDLQPANAVDRVIEHYTGLNAPHRRSGLAVNVDGAHRSYVGLTHVAWPSSHSSVHGSVRSLDSAEQIVEQVAGVVEPIDGFITSGWRYQDRRKLHLEATQAAHGRATFPFTSRWGLSGVACRLLLGRTMIDHIGKDRLTALGEDTAHPIGESWMVAGCDDPEEWLVETRTPREASIIGTLGEEFFFDPVTRGLPTAAPFEFAEPSYPRYVVDASGTAFERVAAGGSRSPVPNAPWK